MSRFGGPTLAPDGVVDVMLLLEGTYPFVAGGVSSWVHQLISGLPGITFGIVFIGGSQDRYDKIRYRLPENLLHLEEHFLSDAPPSPGIAVRHSGNREFFESSARAHDSFREPPPIADDALDRLVNLLLAAPAEREQDFLFGERAWTEICARYDSGSSSCSFLEYFWAVRSMHSPLFLLARIASRVPPARAFHVVSTGFAGFLGMLLRRTRGRPLVLTEHGIYTKERRIELLQVDWIRDSMRTDASDAGVGIIRQLWIRFFESLGKMTYAAADPILALYEGNRQRQIADGAPPSRARVVPNGIAVERFRPARAARTGGVPPVMALIGRVVPIKDIKTFIRAVRIVSEKLPTAEGWIVGPEDEDPQYATECRHLVANLGLRERVHFLGFKKVEDVFPRVGINVLTSISEAQPLAVLEGFAAGVPCVASDVGCCRELIEGVSGEDRALGSAGEVVPIADPAATARGVLALLCDEGRWNAAQRAGIARVEGLYTDRAMLERYRTIYTTAVET
jgi:glycosyltransferase involved in cell wall biosynthesis